MFHDRERLTDTTYDFEGKDEARKKKRIKK
jgi:hypothetical protein